MKPRTRTSGNVQQLRYDLPHRVHCSTTYPVSAPNGSTVIVLGHADGLSILWRGGRPLKAEEESKRPKGPPPSSSDVMVIDFDDEADDVNNTQVRQAPNIELEALTPAEYEEEEDELNLRTPYIPIIQRLDLPFGGPSGGVTHLAAPLLSDAADNITHSNLWRSNMVLAIACADTSLRIIVLPLAPPSDAMKARRALLLQPALAEAGRGAWGETVIELPRSLGHATLMSGISINASPRALVVDPVTNDNEMKGDAQPDEINANDLDLLIASTSADAGGTLLVHRIPINGESGLSLGDVELWRRVLLSGPAVSVDIHGGQLTRQETYPQVLISLIDGPTLIYECSDAESRDDGRFIGELHPDSSETKRSTRTTLSARFILGGSAVLGLVQDGEWGVWDVTTFKTQRRQRGFLYGGSLSTTSLPAGAVGQSSTLAKPQQMASLAPMTPHTRKVKHRALFSGDGDETSSIVATQQPRCLLSPAGVSLLLTSRDDGPNSADGHAILWYRDSAVYVPNLRASHIARLERASGAAKSKSAVTLREDPFSTTGVPSAPKVLQAADNASLCSGSRVGFSILPNWRQQSSGVRSKLPDVLVASERAFSILGRPQSESIPIWQAGQRIARPSGPSSNGTKDRSLQTSAVEALKDGAELAIDGIEGVLDGMARGARRLSGRTR